MKIKIRFPLRRTGPLDWPDGLPIPRTGEFLAFPIDDQGTVERFKVERVTYYPAGEGASFEPVIWVSVT